MDRALRADRRVTPPIAFEGGRVTIEGPGLPPAAERAPVIRIGGATALVESVSTRRLTCVVPAGLGGGRLPITSEGVDGPLGFVTVGSTLASGLHLVDNPLVDPRGRVYATCSGTRGQRVPVSVYRIDPDGTREAVTSAIVNATSLAFDLDGRLCVSSRFDGAVYRVAADGTLDKIASDLGVACGIVFSPEGSLYVGDRGGTLFRVNAARRVYPFATLPPSVAAFHLALGPDDAVYVTAPTLSSSDRVYRVDHRGQVGVFAEGFGRPQGIAFDGEGRLHVVEALAGVSGLYRVEQGGRRELVASGAGFVGVAFHPAGGLVCASGDTLYRFEADLP